MGSALVFHILVDHMVVVEGNADDVLVEEGSAGDVLAAEADNLDL